VAREADVQFLFNQFIRKMEFTIPSNPNAFTNKDADIDPLFPMVLLQRSLLDGFTKRMRDHSLKLPTAKANAQTAAQSTTTSHQDIPAPLYVPGYDPQSMATPQAQSTPEQIRPVSIPPMNSFNFSSINFDSVAPVDSYLPPQLSHEDMLWDTIMDDFALPF
jgi:hypothetical protein